jgi:hypothetical protein
MLKTNQIMVRELDGIKVTQRTKDGYFNATDVLQYYNGLTNSGKRMQDFYTNQNTQEFIKALEQEILNDENSHYLKIIDSTRGRGGSTWFHPYLFVKLCFWLSPQFEVKVIKWVYDNLIDFRHEAGDHYKEMCKSISETYHKWYGKNPDPLIFQREARFLNFLVFGSGQTKTRNEATEQELELMNKLQKINISMINECKAIKVRHEKLAEFADMYKKTM